MDSYDELLEQSATCDGCGCAVCQCHRLQSITWASDGRPYGANFYPVKEDKPMPVEDKRSNWVGWVLLASLFFWVVCCGLLTAKYLGWL